MQESCRTWVWHLIWFSLQWICMKAGSYSQHLAHYLDRCAACRAGQKEFLKLEVIFCSVLCFVSSVWNSEVKLSMASFLSDRIVDEILESLSRSQHTLVSILSAGLSVCLSVCLFSVRSTLPPPSFRLQADHLIGKTQPLLRQEPQMETEVLDEVVLQPENHNQEQNQSHDRDQKHGLEDMDTCMVGKHKTSQTL